MEAINNNFLIGFLITSGVLYLFYKIFLKNSPLFNWNRIYLLFCPVISLIVPFVINILSIKISDTSFLLNQKLVSNASVIFRDIQETTKNIRISNINVSHLIFILYLIIVIYLFLSFLKEIFTINQIKKKNLAINDKNYKLFITENRTNFSFLNSIFLSNKNLSNSEINQIIDHEKVHINHKHSFDLIYFEIIKIIFWFNPFIWLIKKSVQQVHEYIADSKATINKNIPEYSKLIIKLSSLDYNVKLANCFSKILIKKRIIMLNNLKTRKMEKLRFFISIPIIAILTFVLSCSESVKEYSKISEEKIMYDEPPTFENENENNFLKFIQKNISYPTEAVEKGIEGRVYILFEINKKGRVNKVAGSSTFVGKNIQGNYDILGLDEVVIVAYGENKSQEATKLSTNPILENEGIRIIESCPNWGPAKIDGKPVNCYISVPIKFVLQ